MNFGMTAEVVNGGDDMTKESESELISEDMICKMENEYFKTISDIEKYTKDSEKLNNLRTENYYFKTNWQELAAELPTLNQQYYQTPADCTSSKTMVITNRGCRGTEGANATKILFTSSKSEAMQSLERAMPNRFEELRQAKKPKKLNAERPPQERGKVDRKS